MTRKYRNKVGVFQYVAGIPPYCLIAYITGKPINFRSHLPFFLVRDFSCLVFRLRTPRATVPNRAAGRLGERSVPIRFIIEIYFKAINIFLKVVIFLYACIFISIYIRLEFHNFLNVTT